MTFSRMQVVHYDLPRDGEAFLHRSGRTGRAGRKGSTIAVVLNNARGKFKAMCSELRLDRMEIISPPGPQQVMEASAKQVCRRPPDAASLLSGSRS
jgi:superfamily II DNA/RNA helicase